MHCAFSKIIAKSQEGEFVSNHFGTVPGDNILRLLKQFFYMFLTRKTNEVNYLLHKLNFIFSFPPKTISEIRKRKKKAFKKIIRHDVLPFPW